MDDNTTGKGQAPDMSPVTGATQDEAPNYEAMIAELRQENAARRVKAKELEAQLKQAQPLAQQYQKLQEAQKSEQEKMAEKLAQLEAQLAEAETAKAQAAKRQQLTLLATKANVPLEVIPLLNLEAFDLENEETALEALAKLAPSQPAPTSRTTNAAAQRGGGLSDDDMRAWLFGNGQPRGIFGG
jgi:seryl-tRNA synthetase